MVETYYDQGNGWYWYYDDTDNTTKSILRRVVRNSGVVTEVDIPPILSGAVTLKTIESSCFSDVEGKKITKILSMPSTVTLIKANAFLNCTSLTSVVLGTGVATIQSYALAGCTALTAIVLPSSLTTLQTGVFSSCAFTSVVVPGTLTTVAAETFYTCTSLVSVVLMEGVTSVGVDAFYGCSALTTVVLPATLTTIGNTAFKNCTGLLRITIPERVSSIGTNVFQACSKLTSITFLGMVAPTTVGANWILTTPATIRGHAWSASDFPYDADAWNGLTMGNVIEAHGLCYKTALRTRKRTLPLVGGSYNG